MIVAQVPDRGGRPRETRAPVEMPAFKQRIAAAPQERREGTWVNWSDSTSRY